MTFAGYLVEIIFNFLHLIPTQKVLFVLNQGLQLNYTTYLNIGFLFLAIILVWRFWKTGGMMMLKMMNSQ